MIVIKKTKFRIPIYQKWFASTIEKYDFFKIVAYRQFISSPLNDFLFNKKEFYTVETNLLCSDIDIFQRFSSTIRNEIRRCEKDGVLVKQSESIDNFLLIYNEFAKIKGLPLQSYKAMIDYKQNLLITSASINGITLIVHSYLLDKDLGRVRLLHSGSQRFSETIDKNLIARANKFLHYKDICYFKGNNFSIYDWGGISNTKDKSKLGIDAFKLAFGGTKVVQYDCYSYPYCFLMKLSLIKDVIKKGLTNF